MSDVGTERVLERPHGSAHAGILPVPHGQRLVGAPLDGPGDVVRWQPPHRPSSAIVHTPMQGLRTAR